MNFDFQFRKKFEMLKTVLRCENCSLNVTYSSISNIRYLIRVYDRAQSWLLAADFFRHFFNLSISLPISNKISKAGLLACSKIISTTRHQAQYIQNTWHSFSGKIEYYWFNSRECFHKQCFFVSPQFRINRTPSY